MDAERERCARICETFAALVDDGAGAVGRLWQAARMIRSGDPVPGFYKPDRKEPAEPRDPDGEARRAREALEEAQRLLALAGCPTAWIDDALRATPDTVKETK